MFSPTDRLGSSDCSWNTMPMPWRVAWAALAQPHGLAVEADLAESGW